MLAQTNLVLVTRNSDFTSKKLQIQDAYLRKMLVA